MRRLMSVSLFLLLAAGSAFAHAGHIHTYMGTVSMLHGQSAFMMTTTDGKTVTVETAKTTTYTDAGGHAAKPADVVVGTRVVVKMGLDGKTAMSVKIGAKN
jgi:hypothetical protein